MRFSSVSVESKCFPSLTCVPRQGWVCHKGWLIKDHSAPFSLNPQVNPPQILQTGKPQVGVLQLKLHICLGWKARLLSGTSELVLWVQLPCSGVGMILSAKHLFYKMKSLTQVGCQYLRTSRQGNRSFLSCAIASTCLCFSFLG